MFRFVSRTFQAASCALLLAACASTAGGVSPGPSTQEQPVISVVTLNLYHDKADWPKRRVQIARVLRELEPDVIALQEVLQTETLRNQAEWLAEELGYQASFTSTDPAGNARRYGNALLTPHRILKRDERMLQPRDDFRNATMLSIDIRGRVVDVYGTHLHWTAEGAAIRARQLEDLLDFIAATSTRGAPVIVAGDFNTGADAPELAGLRERFADSFGTLHPDAGPETSTLNRAWFERPHRIDHIFHDPARLVPLRSEILFTQPDADGTWASDHYALLSVFTLGD
jgi:beta-glucosidase